VEQETPEVEAKEPATPQQIHVHVGGGVKKITLPDGRTATVEEVQ
jgi:hypothetical protein